MNLWQVLKDMQEAEEQIWSGAYLITTHGRKMTKIDYCVELLQDCIDVTPIHMAEPSCEGYFHAIKRVKGLGSFLAAQIVADLKNTKGHPLEGSMDWYDFSAPGPGSLRGLSWFHHNHITNSMYPAAIDEVAEFLDWQHCRQDLQNCMCEFDKYCRVLTGTGRSKRKYAGS